MTNRTTAETKTTLAQLSNADPVFWLNLRCFENSRKPEDLGLDLTDVRKAEARLHRFASVLADLFPELEPAAGIIESDLVTTDKMKPWLCANEGDSFQGHVWPTVQFF
ncbi:MAG: hypothetical protein R6V54_13875 [Desulfobacteraceae bacterium]